MSFAKLDRRITLQASTATRDAAGSTVITWADVATVWAERVQETGNEPRTAGAIRAASTILFRIRYRAGTTAAMRISYDGQLYDIASVSEVDRREYQLLSATTIAGVTP